MNRQEFWDLVAAARDQVARDQVQAPYPCEAIASAATALLASRPAEEIVAAERVLWDLMSESYSKPLWAAAYQINGGCSDDGFDYFRGWLIAQGREVFELAVAEPDALAELPVVQTAAALGIDLEGEDVLGIAWDAHIAATGNQLPADGPKTQYPQLDPDWNFSFDDRGEMARRLPRLAALFRE
ncbi:DUF4240 domain-containing protein [Streptomyces osmaniensis]|nr:DUF4240 domain-containing protein [Streptomyces sp. JCM17656]